MKQKIAVVLMNLGGPDSLQAVRPFLYNLFSDPAIISYPSPLRQVIAWLISSLRTAKAQKIYESLGGKSPLLENTKAQAAALKQDLIQKMPDKEVEVFIAMRYWHPFTGEVIKKLESFQAKQVVLLPLYPQFSTTTTASSLKLWYNLARNKPWQTHEICCYPLNSGFINAYSDLIQQHLAHKDSNQNLRLLFSAHGLPQKVVDQGDPYAHHIDKSVQAIMATSCLQHLEYQICYQSRVGPLQWLKPSLEDALKQAATDQKDVMVVPISFVSEHSETLVELDKEYREKAKNWGIVSYDRIPTVSTHPLFIDGLARLVEERLQAPSSLFPCVCANSFSKCWCLNGNQ